MQQVTPDYGYYLLALAIIASGTSCHDTEFLTSDWYTYLKDMCSEINTWYEERDKIAHIRFTNNRITFVR